MDSANQIQALVNEVEKHPEYKISEQEAKGFLSEIKRLTKEDKTNMPPLVVIIMAYINMLFPELDEVKIWGKSIKNKIDFYFLLTTLQKGFLDFATLSASSNLSTWTISLMTIPPTKQETSTFIVDLLPVGNQEFIFNL